MLNTLALAELEIPDVTATADVGDVVSIVVAVASHVWLSE